MNFNKLRNSINVMNLILDFRHGDEFHQSDESEQGEQFDQQRNFWGNET